MTGRTLADWLAWQESIHSEGIALGLDRVALVARKLLPQRVAPRIVIVGGTNGKGSAVAVLEQLFQAGGLRTAAYTSPHIRDYRERLRIDGQAVTDETFVTAFERVEAARAATRLTYFEFGTLAALDVIARADLDVAILEVGLGGRLDAVNVIDGDGALVTTVDLDHQEWLGIDREAIGREKAGIFRAGRVAVCGDRAPPETVRTAATSIGANYVERGRDFRAVRVGDRWRYEGRTTLAELPLPALAGEHQVDNAAAVLALLDWLGWLPPAEAVGQALRAVRLPGRLQRIGERPLRIVDVGHNPAAAAALADWLQRLAPHGRVHLVLGMLADKDVSAYVAALAEVTDVIHAGSTEGRRGLTGAALAARIPGQSVVCHDSVAHAWAAALADAAPDDVVLAAGSFLTVQAVLRRTSHSGAGAGVMMGPSAHEEEAGWT